MTLVCICLKKIYKEGKNIKKKIIGVLRNVGIAVGGITFIILLIKMSTEPDNKARYIKLAKNTIIASVLITISLTLLQIPKRFFWSSCWNC